jgi:hypothetical protein
LQVVENETPGPVSIRSGGHDPLADLLGEHPYV